jgi:hypothetical protein
MGPNAKKKKTRSFLRPGYSTKFDIGAGFEWCKKFPYMDSKNIMSFISIIRAVGGPLPKKK